MNTEEFDAEPRLDEQTLEEVLMGLPEEQAFKTALDYTNNIRVLYPGDIMTCDFVPTRVNLELNKETGVVQRVWIG